MTDKFNGLVKPFSPFGWVPNPGIDDYWGALFGGQFRFVIYGAHHATLDPACVLGICTQAIIDISNYFIFYFFKRKKLEVWNSRSSHVV